MAIAGSMTSACQFVIEAYSLKTVRVTMYPRRDCANVEAAMSMLQRGESCMVASGDVENLRSRLRGMNINA